jgi:hypothetical protein
MSDLTETDLAVLRKKAIELYQTNDVQIDPLKDEDVAEADSGYWVRAWVWIPEDAVNLEIP